MVQVRKDDPVPFFLREVFQEKLSGRLSLEGEGYQKSLYFSEGNLAHAQSNRFHEKILVILHLVGKISEDQYNLISGLHQFPDDQVNDLLLEYHYVGKKDLYFARIYQFRRIALSPFLMQQVDWRFEPGEPLPAGKESFRIPLAGILTEGARLIDRASPYAGRWLFHIPRPLRGIPESIDIYYTDEERKFFTQLLLHPDISCRELISSLNIQPIDFWRKTLGFYLLGALGLQKSQGDPDIEKDLQELLALYDRIRAASLDDMSLLGISPESSQASLEEAHAQLRTRFAPERFGSAAAPEIKKIAEAVCQHVDAALQRLVSVHRQAPKVAMVSPAAQAPVEAASPPRDKARDLYMKGKELYEIKEIPEAIEALRQAVRLDPSQGDFYYLLGLCMSEEPILASEAEANLKRAIEMQPWSAEPVYALGVLFRSQKKLQLAERCFQRVKEISFEHTGAGRALVDLRRQKPRKKDRLSFLKKKIF